MFPRGRHDDGLGGPEAAAGSPTEGGPTFPTYPFPEYEY